MPAKPTDTPMSAEVELEVLRAEVARLRELVGPSEDSYIKLKTDVWSARDAVIGAEAEVGVIRARVLLLEAELHRATIEKRWIKAEVLTRMRALKRIHRRILRLAKRALLR